jgi:hypothetical protein
MAGGGPRRRDIEHAAGGAVSNSETGLHAVRAEFPRYRIWRETEGTRVRYIARSLFPDGRPHSVVTADLSELRAELSQGNKQRPQETDRK